MKFSKDNPRRFFDELAMSRLYVYDTWTLMEREEFLDGFAVPVYFEAPEEADPTEIVHVAWDELHRKLLEVTEGTEAYAWIEPAEEEAFFCLTGIGAAALARGENPVNFLGAWFLVDPTRELAETVATIALEEGAVHKNRPTRAKSAEAARLLEEPATDRGDAWLERFRESVLDAVFLPCSLQPRIIGGFPYLVLETPPDLESDAESSEDGSDASEEAGASQNLSPGHTGEANTTLVGVLQEATDKGYGIAVNPNRPGGGQLFRFGDLMSLRQYRTFEAPRPLAATIVDPDAVGEYLVGQPPIHVLPGYALDALEEYLAKQTGKEEVAVTALAQPRQDEYLHLLAPIRPSEFATPERYAQVTEGIAWFLPESYTFLSEEKLDQTLSH